MVMSSLPTITWATAAPRKTASEAISPGGWLSAVEDEKRLHDEISAQYPDLPYYILGHSMGSFLLRTYLYTYPDAVDKAVISGTGWEDPMKVRMGQARLQARRGPHRREKHQRARHKAHVRQL